MVFSAGHIALTAGITAVLGFAAAFWRLPRGAWLDIVAVAVRSPSLLKSYTPPLDDLVGDAL